MQCTHVVIITYKVARDWIHNNNYVVVLLSSMRNQYITILSYFWVIFPRYVARRAITIIQIKATYVSDHY